MCNTYNCACDCECTCKKESSFDIVSAYVSKTDEEREEMWMEFFKIMEQYSDEDLNVHFIDDLYEELLS